MRAPAQTVDLTAADLCERYHRSRTCSVLPEEDVSPPLVPHMNGVRFVPTAISSPPRFHITDDLWNSFTVESVNNSMAALRKRGEIKHPRQFTVRASYAVLTQDISDFHQKWLEDWKRRFPGKPVPDRDIRFDKGPFDAQSYYDFTFDWDADPGYIGIDITQVIKVHRPQIPLAYRKKFQREATANGIMRMHPDRKPYEIIKKMWWEKDWDCVAIEVPDPEYSEWIETGMAKLCAWMLIVCLHERTVRKVKVEPTRAPQSRIAKKLAARRGDTQPDTAPETILYVPAREYAEGDGTHASPHLHYRNPHWRTQPYGPRANPTYKEIWIEGVFHQR